jgi:hypothetical protein
VFSLLAVTQLSWSLGQLCSIVSSCGVFPRS